MRCYFCGSDDLTTRETRSKNESVTVSKAVDKKVGNLIELTQEPVTISATRRKMLCNACHRYFWTVEHYESATRRTSEQDRIINNNFKIGNYSFDLPQSDLSAEEKERITRLIQEDNL